MPSLGRNAPKLLRVVKGKPYASSEDHEEDSRSEARNGAVTEARKMSEADIFAEPKSSDDEAESIPPPPRQTSQTSASAKPRVTTARKPTRTSKRDAKLRVPRAGSFKEGRADRASRFGEDEKENARASPSSSTEKRVADDPFGDNMAYQGARGSKKQKVAATYTSRNIHAPSAPAKKMGYGKGAAKGPSWPQRTHHPEVRSEDHGFDLNPELDAGLAALGNDDIISEPSRSQPSPTKPAPRNLLDQLSAYKQSSILSPSLPNLDPDASGTSTPLSSLPADDSPTGPADTLQTLEECVAEIPEDDDNSICALCQEPVDPEQASLFWIYNRRSVRTQSLFCREHKKHSARLEYEEKGFPEIDWEELPKRIKRLRPELLKLLQNKRESKYRTQHAEKLQSGKAAVLPSRSRRKGKSKTPSQEEESDSQTFHDSPTSTGYYGPRGKRLMMEAITSDLHEEIREVAAIDPVVGRSGFAVYLQAVLVPELTVMLVIEDMKGCTEDEAEKAIRGSGELGALLNEEVDDEVRVESDEEMDVDEDE